MPDLWLRRDGGDQPVTPWLRRAGGDVPVTIGITGTTSPGPEPGGDLVAAMLARDHWWAGWRCGGTEHPEFTAAGIQACAQAGYDALEVSVYRCATGEWVASHDWTTERTTGVRHEIWNTPWDTLSQLSQQAGPLLRLTDIIDQMPTSMVLCLDHKTTSGGGGSAGDLESEAALLDYLTTVWERPGDHVLWKGFAGAASYQRAAAYGIRSMCMLYETDLAGADLSRWDVLGLEYTASEASWQALHDTGKPTIGHIVTTAAGARQATARGAAGYMSGIPSTFGPAT